MRAHERGTLEAVVKARQTAIAAPERRTEGRGRKHALRRAAPVVRAVGDLSGLKANQNFMQLQSELSDIENKLAASRRFFNNAVQEYNTGIQHSRAALFAAVLGSSPPRRSSTSAKRALPAEQAPSVKF